MDEWELVSVVVPTRNSARTLRACLASIRDQTHARLEAVVVDNSSSDATRDIAEAAGCTVLTGGPERSAQRNRGAREANGSYLLFVDSDMVLEQDVVRDCVAAAKSGATAVIVPESSFGEGYWAECKRLERSCYLGDDDIEAARFFSRELFAELGGYDEELHAGEDWDLSQRARTAGATVRRVQSFIRHDEGRLKLSVLMRKKFGYGKSMLRYREKHRDAAKRQSLLLRPAFFRNGQALAGEPLVTAGMILMKTMETLAVAAGASTTVLPRRASRHASPEDTGAMPNAGLDEYSEKHRHFTTGELPPLLAASARPGVIADLGCGDGAILDALRRAGRLGEQSFGVDVSDLRVQRAARVPGVTGIVADAASVPLPDGSVDGVICSQVIEHVPDESALISEIARLLRPDGWWYIGSCLRGPRAWWIYKHHGKRWLDPTHVREYQDEQEFQEVIGHDSLQVTIVRSEPIRYPILDLALRATRRDGRFYDRHPWCLRLRALRVRVPGYRLVEATGSKRA